jgi:2-amino-4-hydroxy-6-hydroxymethyldihydropteridine diphosphokinase
VPLAYLSLGSNVGDRAEHLARGVEIVAGDDPYRLSQVYETEPVGGITQDNFWNLVMEIDTVAGPRDLLVRAQRAEEARGRVREVRWGPRTLDVDVLLLGEQTSDAPEILVPHPRIFERRFVMVPLAELAPALVSAAQMARGEGKVVALGTLELLR